MQIASYLPDLTVAEADRYWLLPAALCELVAVGDPKQQIEVRKFLSNITSEGHVPSERLGPSRTHPNGYSCISAIMMRTMWEVMQFGGTYKFAGAVAANVGTAARKLIETCATLDDIDAITPLTVYTTGLNGAAKVIGTLRAADFSLRLLKGGSYNFGLLQSGEIIFNVMRGYADLWAKDLTARGHLVEDPRAIGPDGWPLP